MYSSTINKILQNTVSMKRKSTVDDSGVSAEEAKEMEADEQPRPTRKEGKSALPSTELASSHKKIKGTRKIK